MKQGRRRTLEIATALAIALLGVIVSAESLSHDIGWNDTGPGAGYFPFRVGLLLVAGAAVLAVQHLPESAAVFVTGDQFRRTLGVFVPAVALVAGMFVLGCYVPSAIYLAWMLRRGGYRWIPSAAFGVAAMSAFYLVFDVWFRVPLAKGPLEAALGLY